MAIWSQRGQCRKGNGINSMNWRPMCFFPWFYLNRWKLRGTRVTRFFFCLPLSGRAGFFFSFGGEISTDVLFVFISRWRPRREAPADSGDASASGPLRLVQHETQTAAAMAGGWPTAKRPLNFPSNDSKPMRNNGPMNNENKKLLARPWPSDEKWKTVDRNQINICWN